MVIVLVILVGMLFVGIFVVDTVFVLLMQMVCMRGREGIEKEIEHTSCAHFVPRGYAQWLMLLTFFVPVLLLLGLVFFVVFVSIFVLVGLLMFVFVVERHSAAPGRRQRGADVDEGAAALCFLLAL